MRRNVNENTREMAEPTTAVCCGHCGSQLTTILSNEQVVLRGGRKTKHVCNRCGKLTLVRIQS